METCNCDLYQIFMCDDKCSSQSYDTRHNYLIISVDDPEEKGLGLVQAMSITSMQDKEVKLEVPIKLSNNLISYILPYNIHSFKAKDFSNRDYKGVIKDSSYCTREQFIQLLLKLYMYSLGIGGIDKEAVMKEYHDYCDEFWKNNKESKEFREEKSMMKDSTQTDDIINRGLNLNPAHTKRSRYQYTEYDKLVNQTIKNKITKKKMNNRKRKEERREQKAIKNMMRECIGNTKLEYNNVTVYETVPKIKEIKVPYKNYNIELEDLKILENSSKNIKDWKDEDIILFMKGYKKFGFKSINNLLPNKWKSASTISKWYSLCKEESVIRKLPSIVPLSQINKPISSWKDNDIRYYLAIVHNHRHDNEFLLDITGFSDIELCSQTTYQVKEEAKKRNLLFR